MSRSSFSNLAQNDILRGQPADAMKKNLAEIIDRAKSRGAAVLLAGMEAPTNPVSNIAKRYTKHSPLSRENTTYP
jgi:lysophospholipase L1-like esterase